jgi:hypothetical protein
MGVVDIIIAMSTFLFLTTVIVAMGDHYSHEHIFVSHYSDSGNGCR